MLLYLYANELRRHPKLAESMFGDRADQFHTRLGWDVLVDEKGRERDEYDRLNPLYVIWRNSDGSHGGSMRLLPTTGSVMVNDHFGHLIEEPLVDPSIWECTRFCLSRNSKGHVGAALMLGGSEVMKNLGVDKFVGVFDARMVRIYRMIGSSPKILAARGAGREEISVGLWKFDQDGQVHLAERAGLSLELSNEWFRACFSKRTAIGQTIAA